MKLLLDTHVWIWSLMNPVHLPLRVRKELKSSRNELWLSPVSVWEFLTLVRKGRILLQSTPESWLKQAQARLPLREAPLTREAVLAGETQKLSHEDPADRFLVGTASCLGLTLVTADKRLIQSQA